MGMRWLARGEHDVPADLGWLTGVEADRLAGLRFTKRRTEFLLRRWTAKQAVAGALGLPTGDGAALARIAVLNHPSGAPYVLLDGEPLGQDISVTDRAGWAVSLVGTGLHAVGCDLEIVEPRSEGFIEDFLTGAEQRYVRSYPPGPSRDAAANLLWSAKESALKVLRTGLRADTRSVEVVPEHDHRDDGWAALTVHGQDGATFPGWWRRDGVFLLTVAFTTPTAPPRVLASSADLTGADPVHSWMAAPTVG